MKVMKFKKGIRLTIGATNEKEKLLEIIEFRNNCLDHLDELRTIIKFPHNVQQRAIGGVLSTAMNAFDYGVIIGKRIERAKHNKATRNTNIKLEILEDEEELKLKLDNYIGLHSKNII